MNLYNVLLNNKIPFVLLESNEVENAIYCKSFSDYLFDVGTFATKTKDIILEYTAQDGEKYASADVTFEDGTHYAAVSFKIIIDESIETPYSTINLNSLENGTQVNIPQKTQQIIEHAEEIVVEPAPIHVSTPIIETPDYTETINETLKLQRKLNVEKEELREQKILLEKQNLVNKKLQEYKQELLEEYVTAVDKQKQFLGAHVKETLTLVEHDLGERITNTFNEYNYELENFQSKSRADQLEFIIEKINDSIVDVKIDLNSLVASKFTQEHDVLLDVLQAKSQLLQEKYEQKLLLELERYKEALFEEFRLSSQEAILQVLTQKKDLTEQQISIAFANREKEFNSSFEMRLEETSLELDDIIQEFSSKLPVISSNISTLETRLKGLLEEKKKSDEVGKFNTAQQKFITDTAQYWARRMLDLGGGGGSVAVQYAGGGVMNGNLSVNNLFPNNNTGEIGSPTNRWSKIYANQIDALSANVVVELSGFFVDGDFTVNGVITASGGNSNQWNTAYTNLVSNSSNYLSGASVSYVNTNFVKISGDNMTGPLTVTGSLSTTQGIVCAPSAFTASDTVSDAALIMDFTRGAATGGMYVRRSNGQQRSIFNYQDSTGNIDVGTFSNNINSVSIKAGGSNLTGYINLGTSSTNNAMRVIDSGNIGVGTITPNEKLTAVGNISASGVVYALGGNSNQWNSNYTTTNLNSAFWTNAYTNLVSNSSNYLSGASVSYVNTNFVKLSGDTMTGPLTITGSLSASGTLSGAKMELLPAAANGMLIRTTTAAGAQDACHIVVRPISSTANVATAINLRASGGSGEIYDGYICSSNGVINVGGSGVSTIFRVTNGNSGPNSGSSQFSVNTLATVNVDIANSNAAATVLRVTGSTAQTGNLTEWRNVTPTTLAFITPTGAFSTVSSISSQSTGFFNHVAAATKSFYIPHPTKPDMHLQYGSLESPYHGVRLTGNGSVKSGDSVVVSLPDYIFSLVHQEGVNIQLTNYQHNKTLFVDDIDVKNNTFTVKCEKKLFDKGEYKFFWSFTAIRKDIPQLTVEC